MICPHCQKELSADISAANCSFCGKDLSMTQLPPSDRAKPNSLVLLAILLAPAVLTVLAACVNSELSANCALLGSAIAGIISGCMLGQAYSGKSRLIRVLATLFL